MKTKTVRSVKGLLLAAGLLFGLTASAGAPVYVNSMTALKNAVNAAPAGVETMIVLTADATGSTCSIAADKNIVIDLNGHKIKTPGTTRQYVVGVASPNVTIMNSSTTSGEVSGCCLYIQEGGCVHLRGKIMVEYLDYRNGSTVCIDDKNVTIGTVVYDFGTRYDRGLEAGTAAELATAIDNAAAGAVIKLTADITASGVTLNSGKDFNIDLNGKTLNLNQTHFYVNSGATLGLLDSAGGGKVTNGKSGYGGFVEIKGGSFNMYAGTIDGCTSDGKGGGTAYMWGGAFNMYGGVIQNCSSTGDGSCIFAQSSSMINIYNGAKITGCKSGHYGTILVLASGGQSPVVDLNGCEISNNSASWGSGLWVQDSSTVNIVDTIINGQLRIQSGPTVTASGYCTITSFSGASYSNNGTKSKITFDFQSGSGGTASVDPATYGSAMPAATMPTRTGYTFLGYYDATSGGTQYYKADGTSARNWDKVVAATTLYARWSENTATLSYNANGHGTAPTAVTMKYTAACNAAAAITGVTGYTFSKWNTKADGKGTSYNANAQVKAANVNPTATTLYAIWTANAYTVAFDGNGATGGATASLSCTYDVAFTMPGCGFTKDGGYAFTGWNTAADGSGTAYAAGANCLNLSATQGATVTLYAQWAAAGSPGNPWSVGGDVVAYTNGTGGLVISGTGAAGDFSKQSPAPWAAFADQIKSVTIADGVTGIGSRFFKGCTRLGTVTGGKNLTSVGENAFYQCMSLETIELDNAEVLGSLENAIVYQTAIDAQGKPYVIPRIDIPGYKNVLYGTVGLAEPKWEEVPEGTTMEESGYHFFKFVLEAVK